VRAALAAPSATDGFAQLEGSAGPLELVLELDLGTAGAKRVRLRFEVMKS
jgi:hypothetical protein